MVDQVISAPTDLDITHIAESLIHADQMCKEIVGSALHGTNADLSKLQRVIDSGLIDRAATYSLQALGMAFGKVFVKNNLDFDWWMVEDEYGRDPAVRYKKTALMVFPRTMLSKRIEDGQAVDVQQLYNDLQTKMTDLIDRGYY